MPTCYALGYHQVDHDQCLGRPKHNLEEQLRLKYKGIMITMRNIPNVFGINALLH